MTRRNPFAAVAKQVLRDLFEVPLRPARKATPKADPSYEVEHGIIYAQGDESVARALGQYVEAGGRATPAAMSIAQLAGRLGAAIVVTGIEGGPLWLSVRMVKGFASEQLIEMLRVAEFSRTFVQGRDVAYDEWDFFG